MGRPYDALETGGFQHAELAPRTRELTVELGDEQVVRDCAEDLKNLLAESAMAERCGFLRSFVDKVEVYDTEVKMHYTIPVPPDSTREETVGVIPVVPAGRGMEGMRPAPVRGPFHAKTSEGDASLDPLLTATEQGDASEGVAYALW